MKTIKLILLAVTVGMFGNLYAQSTKTEATKDAKATYFVQVPHNPQQCLASLDEMKQKGDNLLSKLEFGCHSGDHTAYGFIQADNEQSVRDMLPTAEQKDAKVTKVERFNAADIEKLHKQKM